MNRELINYIETEIIPRYQHFDSAHQTEHARYVIKESMQLANHYHVNPDMVYTIAAYHDTGLCEGRDVHHLISGKIIRADKKLRSFFTEEEIETMAEAVEDHRASIDHEPRTIYGKIVAEADRCIDSDTIIRRTIQYGLSHYPNLNKNEHYLRFLDHMKEKYAEGGYLKIWLDNSTNAIRLKEFQTLLRDKNKTQELFEKHWNAVVTNKSLI